MLKTALLLSPLLLAAFPASADPTDALRAAVSKCWLVKPEMTGQVAVTVSLDPNGSLASPPTVTNPAKQSAAMATSAIRAIKRCAPYTDAIKGVDDFPLDVEMIFEALEMSE